ncbi:hypothetical protein [endosymbiont GvMRE of Glomus versiforme]|uniref:hypothetical protein n=1 Tax=endosymbiont GvMRE of Glomus versiforme TaxID=2039283 RepID=UPI000ED944BC|nr:hypothetical protein [endosymbiont GvMRE of Glomus versiforme]RHZ37609.1 Aspartyl/glutamyl-tRNA(Asn/Gln) amidotransferase subunit B [endosymbiont GvMRE of Glomus versiforme]
MIKKENNLLFSAQEYENWATFFLNYLNPYFSDENFSLFQKRWKSYWKLFQLWKEKKLETDEIKNTVEQLITTKKSLAYLIKKYQKKEITDNSLIFSELEKLWDADLVKKYSLKPQKIQNFLLGQIKKQFPDLDMRKINEIISEFINKQQKS